MQVGGGPTGKSLGRFKSVHASTPKELEQVLATLFTRPVISFEKADGPFQATINICELANIGINYATYSVGLRTDYPPLNCFLQAFPISGASECAVGNSSGPYRPMDRVLISPGQKQFVRFGNGFQRLVLKLRPEPLAQKLMAFTGAAVTRDLQVNSDQDPTDHLRQKLREHLESLIGALTASPALPPLMLDELEQVVMVTFLCGNRHNYSHLLDGEPLGVAPWQVKRAEDFIDAHWQQAIKIEDIAVATGSSARSIFRAFKQSRGYSPMEFVKQVRLRHAKRMLSSTENHTTVTDVAFACGFGDVSRFSREYRQGFGERPSDALNRSKCRVSVGVSSNRQGAGGRQGQEF